MSETPKYLTEEWQREGDTIFASEDFCGETRSRWRACVERCDFDFDKQEIEAIARLMQAAPKLLAACVHALGCLENEDGDPGIALREAIGEATGGAE